jgi:hypothetical protein
MRIFIEKPIPLPRIFKDFNMFYQTIVKPQIFAAIEDEIW